MTAVTGCPYAHGVPFDPVSIEAAADPQPWLEVARREMPVFYLPDQQVYCVTRYRDIAAVLKDTATFSSRYANKFRPMTSLRLKDIFPHGHPGMHSMTLQDPPAHNRIDQPRRSRRGWSLETLFDRLPGYACRSSGYRT